MTSTPRYRSTRLTACFDGNRPVAFTACETCGAVVLDIDQPLHDRWHAASQVRTLEVHVQGARVELEVS